MSQQGNASRNLLLGVIVCGLLLVGIAVMISVRQSLNMPTPTPPEPTSIPGVILLDPPRELVDFTMPASTGQPLSLSDLRGKYTLLFFGYTHCPDFCPLTLTHWKSMKAVLDADGADLNYIFVSVDGERDTPDIMARYLSRFDPAFVGLTGDPATLENIGLDYGLDYTLNKSEGENYSVDHTTRTYLLNPQGQMIAVFSFDVPEDVIVQTIENAIPQAAA
jgi:protein SCO1/2